MTDISIIWAILAVMVAIAAAVILIIRGGSDNEYFDGAEIDETLLEKDLRRALKDINFNANKGG